MMSQKFYVFLLKIIRKRLFCGVLDIFYPFLKNFSLPENILSNMLYHLNSCSIWHSSFKNSCCLNFWGVLSVFKLIKDRKFKFWDHWTIGTFAILLLQSGVRITLGPYKKSFWHNLFSLPFFYYNLHFKLKNWQHP